MQCEQNIMVAAIRIPIAHQRSALEPGDVWLRARELSADAWHVHIHRAFGDGVVELDEIVGLVDERLVKYYMACEAVEVSCRRRRAEPLARKAMP